MNRLLEPKPGIFAWCRTMITPVTARCFEHIRKEGATGKVYALGQFTDDFESCTAPDAGHTIHICTGPWISHRPRTFSVLTCGIPPPAGVWNTDYPSYTDNNNHIWTMGDGVTYELYPLTEFLLSHFGQTLPYAIRWGVLWLDLDIADIREDYIGLHFNDGIYP